jgi:hypothetical protein
VERSKNTYKYTSVYYFITCSRIGGIEVVVVSFVDIAEN